MDSGADTSALPSVRTHEGSVADPSPRVLVASPFRSVAAESSTTLMAHPRRNPFLPDEADAPRPDDGNRHVRFSTQPLLADLVFIASPVSKKEAKRLRKANESAAEGDGAATATGDAKEARTDDNNKEGEDAAPSGGSKNNDEVSDDTTTTSEEDESLELAERLHRRGQRVLRRRARCERKRAAEKAAAELAEATFTPKISKTSQDLKAKNWLAALKDAKVRQERANWVWEKKKEKIECERDQECHAENRAKPCDLSVQLVEHMKSEGRYGNPVAKWHSRFANFLVKRSGSPTKAHQAQSRAAAAPRDEAVFDRLHQEATTRRVAQHLVIAAHLDAEATELFRPLTNHRMSRIHASTVSHYTGGERHGTSDGGSDGYDYDAVAQRLLERRKSPGTAAEADALDNAENIFGSFQQTMYLDDGIEDDDDGANSPPPYSAARRTHDAAFELGTEELIAAGDPSPPRDPDVVVAELLEKGREYQQRAEQRRKLKEAETLRDCTFKPATNPRSRAMLQNIATEAANDTEAFASRRRIRGGADADEEAKALDAEFAAAVAGHTPAPHLLRHTERELLREARRTDGGARSGRDGATAPTSAGRRKFDVDLFTSRAMRAESEKKEKLARMRAEKEAVESSGCTFRPRLCPGSAAATVREPKLATSPHFSGKRTINDQPPPPPATSSLRPAIARSPHPTAVPNAQATVHRVAAASGPRSPNAPNSSVATPRKTSVAGHVAARNASVNESQGSAATTLRFTNGGDRRNAANMWSSAVESPAPSAPYPTSQQSRRRNSPPTGNRLPLSTTTSEALLTADGGGAVELDDGMAYLSALEDELKGVLEEWRRIE